MKLKLKKYLKSISPPFYLLSSFLESLMFTLGAIQANVKKDRAVKALLLSLVILLPLYLANEHNNYLRFILFFYSIPLALMITPLLFNSFLRLAWVFLHHLLPGKRFRHRLLLTIEEESIQEIFERRGLTVEPPYRHLRPGDDLFIQVVARQHANRTEEFEDPKAPDIVPKVDPTNLKDFLGTYFERTPSSFVRFYAERMYSVDTENEKKLDESFINLSLLIPRRKTLPLDHLKTILISNQGQGSPILRNKVIGGNIKGLTKEALEDNLKITEAFKDYTDDQIKNLFTRRHAPQQWLKILRFIFEKEEAVLPVLKTMNELIDYMDKLKLRKVFYGPLTKLPRTYLIYSFERIQNEYERLLAGRTFQNCLRNSAYENSDLVLVKKGGIPTALLEISPEGRILQLLGPQNKTLEEKDESHIQEFMKNLRKK